MKKSQFYNFLMAGFLLLIIGGCASPISKNLREEALPSGDFPLVFENPEHFQDRTVVWGGSIISIATNEEGSQVYLLQTTLGFRDKPESTDTSQGRFIAITDRHLDPLVYAKGRLITVAGQVAGKKTVVHKKSGNSYTYPVVRAEQLYLWPKKETPAAYGPYYDPYWWDGYDPFWDYPHFRGYDDDERWEGRRDEDRDRDYDRH